MPENRNQHEYHRRNKEGQGTRMRQEETNKDVVEAKQKVKKYEITGLSELPADELVDMADKLGKYFSSALKTTQLRKFLDGIRRLEVQFEKGKNFNKEMVILMKPKLAYAVGRNKDIKPLMDVIEPAITAGAREYKDFKRLVAFIEGIVAYHRYHGGRDS